MQVSINALKIAVTFRFLKKFFGLLPSEKVDSSNFSSAQFIVIDQRADFGWFFDNVELHPKSKSLSPNSIL